MIFTNLHTAPPRTQNDYQKEDEKTETQENQARNFYGMIIQHVNYIP